MCSINVLLAADILASLKALVSSNSLDISLLDIGMYIKSITLSPLSDSQLVMAKD